MRWKKEAEWLWKHSCSIQIVIARKGKIHYIYGEKDNTTWKWQSVNELEMAGELERSNFYVQEH